VLYDHFASKHELWRQLLVRYYCELRSIWHENLPGIEPLERRVQRTMDAWFAYVQAHPAASRMMFAAAGAAIETDATRGEMEAESHALLLPMFRSIQTARDLDGDVSLVMMWELWRTSLQGLAIWWLDHPSISRQDVVSTAMQALWFGLAPRD
jgi:AcrR family transcriptional regulator